MKKFYLLALLLLSVRLGFAQSPGDVDHYTSVTFPANFVVGDYIECVRVYPVNASSSGYYEVSISYLRGNLAASATHIVSVSHANPSLWREAGRVNGNDYVNPGSYNFTVDCNTEHGNSRIRIRAVKTLGVTDPLTVYIKIRPINFNSWYDDLNITGNDLTVNKFLPMTNDWSLYVGNNYLSDGASLAIKAISNGNVGIGTANPTSKLSVDGTILAKKVKVSVNPADWPDYVFSDEYTLPALPDVEQYIRTHKHLPEIPSAKAIETEGHDLGEINKKLLQKVEELTLYIIEENKQKEAMKSRLDVLEQQVQQLLKK